MWYVSCSVQSRMNIRLPISALAILLFTSSLAEAWDHYEFDLPAKMKESAWRDALAARLDGQSEVRIEGGRIDVLTDEWAIELDWPHKWHEGLGQALHYADATGKQGVVALISYTQGADQLREKTRRRFELVERQCEKNGIKLIVLFPTLPRELPAKQLAHLPEDHWLNTASGTRHNVHCHFYRNTDEGRDCLETEGRACSLCGG